jgi:hypothetical protein
VVRGGQRDTGFAGHVTHRAGVRGVVAVEEQRRSDRRRTTAELVRPARVGTIELRRSAQELLDLLAVGEIVRPIAVTRIGPRRRDPRVIETAPSVEAGAEARAVDVRVEIGPGRRGGFAALWSWRRRAGSLKAILRIRRSAAVAAGRCWARRGGGSRGRRR